MQHAATFDLMTHNPPPLPSRRRCLAWVGAGRVELMALDDATHADSAVQVAARFVVDAKQPGAQTG